MGYSSAGTFEFLVDASEQLADESEFFFIEANARLQVEHTITEEVLGIDLVRAQLEIAGGKTLAELGLLQSQLPEPRGFAIQARVNMETMERDGTTRPTGGTLATFEPPTGPGVRVDTFGYAGYATSARFDSLLAKVIGSSRTPEFADTVRKTRRALSEFRIEGVETNLPFLRALLAEPEFERGNWYTRYIDDHASALWDAAAAFRPAAADPAPAGKRLAGARLETNDPLAVLAYGKAAQPASKERQADVAVADGASALVAPLQGTVVSVAVAEGDAVRAGQVVAIMESMKMEHEVRAEMTGESCEALA